MGTIFTSECPCGFKSRDLHVGCGMVDTGADALPVACPQCHVVWVEHSRSGKGTCHKCKAALYYLHEDGNFTPADVLNVFKVSVPWELRNTEEEIETIPEVRYRCPACGKMEMQLVFGGCWD
jgi:ribosomal protein L37AE/L43A